MLDGGRGQMCAVQSREGGSILYCSVRSLTRIDVSFWKGSRELWEQKSGWRDMKKVMMTVK